jgi:hypothetical protein
LSANLLVLRIRGVVALLAWLILWRSLLNAKIAMNPNALTAWLIAVVAGLLRLRRGVIGNRT